MAVGEHRQSAPWEGRPRVRVVDVQVGKTVYLRPIVKLATLLIGTMLNIK